MKCGQLALSHKSAWVCFLAQTFYFLQPFWAAADTGSMWVGCGETCNTDDGRQEALKKSKTWILWQYYKLLLCNLSEVKHSFDLYFKCVNFLFYFSFWYQPIVGLDWESFLVQGEVAALEQKTSLLLWIDDWSECGYYAQNGRKVPAHEDLSIRQVRACKLKSNMEMEPGHQQPEAGSFHDFTPTISISRPWTVFKQLLMAKNDIYDERHTWWCIHSMSSHNSE